MKGYKLNDIFKGKSHDKFMTKSILAILVVQCEWSAWSVSTCSQTCDWGTRIKTRKKVVKEMGSKCNGKAVMIENCNFFGCPGIKQMTVLP